MLGWAITLSTLPWYLPPYFIPNCWFSLPSRYRAARGERLPGPLPATQFTYNALRQARVNRVSEFDIIESLSSVIFTQLTVLISPSDHRPVVITSPALDYLLPAGARSVELPAGAAGPLIETGRQRGNCLLRLAGGGEGRGRTDHPTSHQHVTQPPSFARLETRRPIIPND